MTDTTQTTGNGADAATGGGQASARDAIGVLASEAQDRARDAFDGVRGMAMDRAGMAQLQVDDFVRTRPWEAVAFAAMAGMAFGLLLRR